VRENLDAAAERRMAVVHPLKVTLSNYPADKTEMLTAQNHPSRPELGSREVPFGRELFVECDDFMEDAPNKFFRLKPGGEVRLRFAYIIRCEEVVKDANGEVVELICSVDHETRSGLPNSERKVKGTIHWVSATLGIAAEVRLYDRLFTVADPASADDIHSVLNPASLEVAEARLEPSLARAAIGTACQFERLGYFCPDAVDHSQQRPVFNRIVTLRDGWAKIEKQALQGRS
jgi:glutaminyl-tRNA synthetase